eukprot:3481120-Pyramimonas_sp.AAC.1
MHVVGLAIFQTKCVPDISTFLLSSERAVLDYWAQTKYRDDPILLVRVEDAVELSEPVHMYTTDGTDAVKSLFTLVSDATCRRCMRAGVNHGVPLGDVIGEWERRHGVICPKDDQGSPNVQTGAVMAMPHAILCSRRIWTAWGFPVGSDFRRSRGLRMSLVRPLWRNLGQVELQRGVTGVPCEDGRVLDIDELQGAADVLLKCVSQMARNHAFTDEAIHHATWLQNMRNHMLVQQL